MKIIIFLILINIVISINTTDCATMYKNGTIITKCVNSTSCCIINYIYKDDDITTCIIKNNNTENLCNQLSDRISLYGGEVEECNCSTFYINVKLYIIILTLTLI